MAFLPACMWWADAPFIGIADRLAINSFASENAACKTEKASRKKKNASRKIENATCIFSRTIYEMFFFVS